MASVLFVCVRNGGKSQMAAAHLRQVAEGRIDVRSAGTHPDAEVHDGSARAVAELGASMEGQVPRAVDLRQDGRIAVHVWAPRGVVTVTDTPREP